MQESARLEPDRPAAEAATGTRPTEGARRLSVVHFLVAVVLLLLVVPFVDELRYGDLIEAVLVTLVLLSAVMAVGGRRRTLVAAAVLVTPPVLAKWIDHFRPGLIPETATNVASMVFVAFVIVHLIRFILRAPRVNNEVLCAGIATYLMMGLLWTFAYTLVARVDPGSFLFSSGSAPHRPMAEFEALFVSFGTLTNVPYGEVSPVSKAARMLMMAEAMTGIFFVAVVLARLVSLYSSSSPESPQAG